MNKPFILSWWSAGITSAVTCKYALELYENVKLFYIHIDSAHPDNERFKKDCEDWYGCKIETIKSKKFKDQFDVIENIRFINSPTGASCTLHLKKMVRYELESYYAKSLFNDETIIAQAWGYEFERSQINRVIRHYQQNGGGLFPLIEKGITKNQCAGLLINAGIELPEMYKKGYNNNNCIGCVKGGMGYWNKIRVDFPETFNKMAKLERELGHSCIKNCFLDKLKPEQGRDIAEIMPSCSNICEVDFTDIEDKSLSEIMSGQTNIYDACKNKPK